LVGWRSWDRRGLTADDLASGDGPA
jgi:hypothetical protein